MVSKVRNALGCGCLGVVCLFLLLVVIPGSSRVSTQIEPPASDSVQSHSGSVTAKKVLPDGGVVPLSGHTDSEHRPIDKTTAESNVSQGQLLQTAVNDHAMTGRFAPRWQHAILQKASSRIIAEKRRIRDKFGDDIEVTYPQIVAMQPTFDQWNAEAAALVTELERIEKKQLQAQLNMLRNEWNAVREADPLKTRSSVLALIDSQHVRDSPEWLLKQAVFQEWCRELDNKPANYTIDWKALQGKGQGPHDPSRWTPEELAERKDLESSLPREVKFLLELNRVIRAEADQWKKTNRLREIVADHDLYEMQLEQRKKCDESLSEWELKGFVYKKYGEYVGAPAGRRKIKVESRPEYLEKQATGKLTLARQYIKLKRVEKARELLRELLEMFPETEAGKEAVSELNKLE